MLEYVRSFMTATWDLIVLKHKEGVYNSVCLAVLLILPLLLLILAVCLCCHGCCCGRGSCCKCCHRQQETSKKKKLDDLWIPSQPQPIMMESLSVPV
ncbi:uncharacterized protein KIAA0040 homolog [Scyliorhinus canicula]|uniref:uncharacterized protein KIAA0040 homolog n=1 Tax=Scyliorhinus canicula TaxID=7830 RepID=UPI0018F506E7|nr:uncharacterized protein KIAA0040 homolog [Scyliorhinus canicula]